MAAIVSQLIAFLKSGAAKPEKWVGAGLAVLLCLVLLHQAYNAVYGKGYAAGETAITAQWQLERAELLRQNQVLSVQVLHSQIDLITQGMTIAQQSQEQIQHVTNDYEQRMAAVRADTVRVYVRAKAVPASPVSAGAATASATAELHATGCELDPQVVADLAAIARDGDIAIIERNELIARYNAAAAALQRLAEQQKHLQDHPQEVFTP